MNKLWLGNIAVLLSIPVIHALFANRLLTDYASPDFLLPVLLPIIIAVIFFLFGLRENREIMRMTRATARSLINEKIAMTYFYISESSRWKDMKEVQIVAQRIRSDLEAVGSISHFIEPQQENRFREATEILVARMEVKFPDQASIVKAAFDSIKW